MITVRIVRLYYPELASEIPYTGTIDVVRAFAAGVSPLIELYRLH